MQTQATDCELQLVAEYQRLVELYDQAIVVARRIARPNMTATSAAGDLALLNQLQAGISAQTASAAAHRTKWDDLKTTPGQPLKTILQRLADSIRTLLDLVNQSEMHFQAVRKQLTPQFEQQLTARRMLNAYGENSQ